MDTCSGGPDAVKEVCAFDRVVNIWMSWDELVLVKTFRDFNVFIFVLYIKIVNCQ